MQSTHFDIILAGTGLSGFTLALELVRRPGFCDKKILLLDRDRKEANDRTWCFWATPEESLPPVQTKTWDHCWFFSPDFSKKMAISPYRYCMVRGSDFYRHARQQLEQSTSITRLQTLITGMDKTSGTVYTEAGAFTGDLVFNSALTPVSLLPAPSQDYPQPPLTPLRQGVAPRNTVFLLQHFKGWLIRTPLAAFDPGAMTFMDFRIEQAGQTRFVYVLPLSQTEALVEFTIFSPALLSRDAYDKALRHYLAHFLDIKRYDVLEEEFGVIPMTDFPFPSAQEGRVIHIGTTGGFVKASSGYAFKRTQRKIRAFVDDWEHHGKPNPRNLQSEKLFRVFDSIFLRTLRNNEVGGREIFTSLFQKLPPDLVFRFLDEDSTFAENFRLVNSPPAWPFLKAFFEQLPRLYRI